MQNTLTSFGSNNTNKLSPQEQNLSSVFVSIGSNNTNKLSPQERWCYSLFFYHCSNNTNKLSPQEPEMKYHSLPMVQIIQINLALKNIVLHTIQGSDVQIIQINLALKNSTLLIFPF